MNTDYTVKGFRRINGHDGQGWEANLYHGKTKIAEAFDDGWGGAVEIRWVVPTKFHGDGAAVRQHTVEMIARHTPNINQWLSENEGWWTEFIDSPSEESVAWFIEHHGRVAEDQKIAKRTLRSKFIVKVGSDLWEWKRLPAKNPNHTRADAAIRKVATADFPDGIVLNDLPIAEATLYLTYEEEA